MRRIICLVLVLALVLVGTGCQFTSDVEPKNSTDDLSTRELSAEERELWNSTVGVLLQQDLWTSRDAYDASHYLMVPMYYAFYSQSHEDILAFEDFFQRFYMDVANQESIFQPIALADKIQFYYFATEYAALCVQFGYEDKIPQGLPDMAQSCVEDYLYKTEANWGVAPTTYEHIVQVLSDKQYSRRYYSVINDSVLYGLAILCNLSYLAKETNGQISDSMMEAARLSKELFSSPYTIQETEKGGWLFQPGVWADHPDYAYAGNETITPDIQPKIRDDIPWDSSHSIRMAALMNSFYRGQNDEAGQELFRVRREQLATQLMEYVLKRVDGKWLATTFMDGTNGVYRYEYHEEGAGLEGYRLSTSLLLGWWTLLGDSRISECYQDILEEFPMEADMSNPYYNNTTVREQNPFFDIDTAFENGMYECIVMCAAYLHM